MLTDLSLHTTFLIHGKYFQMKAKKGFTAGEPTPEKLRKMNFRRLLEQAQQHLGRDFHHQLGIKIKTLRKFLSSEIDPLDVKSGIQKKLASSLSISLDSLMDFYSSGKECVIEKDLNDRKKKLKEVEKKIIKILDEKIRPAVAKDGGDIKFKEFKDGVVKVQLQGSCSGCPSSTMTLKQGVQNLLCHYLPEVKKVEAI